MLVLGLGLDYGLGFSSDIRLRQDAELRVSHHLVTTESKPLIFTKRLDRATWGSVVRRPDSAIHWIAIFFNLHKIGR